MYIRFFNSFDETKSQESYIFNQGALTSRKTMQQQMISFENSLKAL